MYTSQSFSLTQSIGRTLAKQYYPYDIHFQKAFFTWAVDSVTLESILTATGIWAICIRAQGIRPTVIVSQAGTFIYIYEKKYVYNTINLFQHTILTSQPKFVD